MNNTKLPEDEQNNQYGLNLQTELTDILVTVNAFVILNRTGI